ncbi:MAG: hypothetical protein ACE37K_12635 [Planctomycetota bacterium]
MSDREQDLANARERLLDASLAEVFGRPGASPAAAPSTRRSWLGAAVALLGIGVVAVTLWWSSGRTPHQAGEREVQDPAPIPKPKACTSVEQMLALDVDAPSLLLVLDDPTDLAHVERFRALRQLIVLNPRGEGAAWQKVDEHPDALRPIGTLTTLEVLQLPAEMKLTAPHLRSLAGAERLRSLALPGRTVVDAEAAAALTGLPALRELRIHQATIGSGFLEALAPLRLTHLELNGCPVSAATVYRELAKLPTVGHLAVRFMTGYSEKTPALGEHAFAAFEQMPALVDLDLDESNFDDRFMRRLPQGLQRLRLGHHVMTPSTIADLKRLADLEELIFHHATHYQAVVDLLGALRLKAVFLHGWLDQRVLEAIARHPSLERVTLRLRGRDSLEPLRRAHKLRSLQLRFDRGVPLVDDPDESLLQALRDNGVDVSFDREN